ncbi:MAG: hypothetical protein RL240_4451, partial [Planctomycetota bacterium]
LIPAHGGRALHRARSQNATKTAPSSRSGSENSGTGGKGYQETSRRARGHGHGSDIDDDAYPPQFGSGGESLFAFRIEVDHQRAGCRSRCFAFTDRTSP